MSKKAFQKYQGEQVNQIPAGYVEAMGSIGKAYAEIGASIGKAITSAAEINRENNEIKQQASGVVDETNQSIKRFIDNGDLIVGEDGKVVPAPGKEGIFDSERLNSSLNIYNTTKGRPASELSRSEAKGVLNEYKSMTDRSAALREQRKIDLQEQELKLKEAAANEGRTNENRKWLLDAYKTSQDGLNALSKTHGEQVQSEIMRLGQEDPAGQARRNEERRQRSDDINFFRQKLYETAPTRQPTKTSSVDISGFGEYSISQSEAEGGRPSESPSSAVETTETTASSSTSQSSPSSPATGAPSVGQAPRVVPINESAGKPGEIATGPGVYQNPDGTLTVDTTGADTDLYNRPLRTATDDAYVVGAANVQRVGIARTSDGKIAVTYNKDNANSLMPIVKDVVIANRLMQSGRIRNFTPSQEQLDYVKNSGMYPAYAEGGIAWNKAVVASLVAQGKLKTEPGQSREFLGQGDETIFSIVDDLDTKSNVEVIQSSTAPSSIPGMTGLVPQLPSFQVIENFRKAGVTPSSETLASLRFLDDNHRFASGLAVDIAKAQADSEAARLAAQQTIKERGETASTFATLGTKLGEAMTGYPGVFESSGLQYGFFARTLPNNSATGKPWTKAEIAYIGGNMTSDDPKTQESALKALPLLRADLARNAIGDKALKEAAKATADFENTMGALGVINVELNRQGANNSTLTDILQTSLESIGIAPGGGEMRAAKIHQLFLMGSLREPIVGPGNPAIYEQMLLQSAIPSVDALFRIPKWEQKRLQTLALVSAGSYLTSMRQSGLSATPESVQFINERLKSVYGDRFIPFKAEQLIGPNGWLNVRGNQAEAERWLRANGMSTAADFRVGR